MVFLAEIASNIEEREARMRRIQDQPDPPWGRSFAEFANPLAPLCELWDLGVALERFTVDTILLVRGPHAPA